MTDQEDLDAIRRGYWLRRARDNAGITLSDAAITAGLSEGSGSTVSLWERGLRPMKVHQMKRLAIRYGVPVSLFTDPPMTDDERLVEAIADARLLERAEWEREGARDRRAGDGPDEPRGRRLA
jgi:transcriptional regulator with XRE-family HTH domain